MYINSPFDIRHYALNKYISTYEDIEYYCHIQYKKKAKQNGRQNKNKKKRSKTNNNQKNRLKQNITQHKTGEKKMIIAEREKQI